MTVPKCALLFEHCVENAFSAAIVAYLPQIPEPHEQQLELDRLADDGNPNFTREEQ